MTEHHLCILKHVGFIDLYGCSHANRFMTRYEDSMSDYYGETIGLGVISMLEYVRDVFIIFGESKTTKNRDLLCGDPRYYYEDENIKRFCLYSKAN
jgi:hypothetical protein